MKSTLACLISIGGANFSSAIKLQPPAPNSLKFQQGISHDEIAAQTTTAKINEIMKQKHDEIDQIMKQKHTCGICNNKKLLKKFSNAFDVQAVEEKLR